MKDKIKSFFTKNIPLKIISLILGLAVWAILANSQDPTITRVVNVPITYTNADLLEKNESRIMLSGPETIPISVSVRTSMQSRATASLFKCVADLTDHSGGDISNQRVHVNVSQVGGTNLILDWNYTRNDPNITVVMDEIVTRSFPVELLPTDSLTEGLVLGGSVTFNPASVTVRGPQSKFSSVTAVKAKVSLSEFTEGTGGTFTETVKLALYDGNDRVIEDRLLSVSPSESVMTAIVSRVRMTTVKLAGTTGTVAKGYRYVNYTMTPEQISVYGLKSVVADLSEIVIPESAVDINGLTEDREFTLSIIDYLPDGVSLLEGTGDEIRIMVHVEPLVTEEVPIEVSDIIFTGENEDYVYEYEAEGLKLQVTGLEEDVKVFKISDVLPSVDVSGLEPGTHDVKVQVGTKTGYTFDNAEDLTIQVTITDPAAESSAEEESASGEEPETESGSGERETEEAP